MKIISISFIDWFKIQEYIFKIYSCWLKSVTIKDIFGFSTLEKSLYWKFVKSILLYKLISFLTEYKFSLAKIESLEIDIIKKKFIINFINE